VVWQAGPRTRLHSALRYSRGRWRAGYSLAERSDPTAPEEIASSSRADYDVTACLVTAGVEQRLGTLRAGVALSGGLVTAGDNLEQPGAPASGDGMVVSPGLPFSFWLGVPW
ncbi:MAG: hypothetical protein HUU35_15860, partial [Armatimonadetes bacterium]|nr:hypothetical protein [Armatimonadota bacterium]